LTKHEQLKLLLIKGATITPSAASKWGRQIQIVVLSTQKDVSYAC